MKYYFSKAPWNFVVDNSASASGDEYEGEMISIKTVVGEIKCEKAIIKEWHVILDIKENKQYFAKSFNSCEEGIQKKYSGEIGNEVGDANFVVFNGSGSMEIYNDSPIYMIVKCKCLKCGSTYLSRAIDFMLEFELLDDTEIEVVERVHYSENTIDDMLRKWSEKLSIPIYLFDHKC